MREIYLAPLEPASGSLLGEIKSRLGHLIGVKIHIIKLDVDINPAYSSERNQYHSTAIISSAAGVTGDVTGNVVLLLQSDLYVPVLTYVFGEAQLNGKLSIISLCRLHEEFYTGQSNEELLINRALKEILHEIGHNYGLFHCRNWDCVMHSSAGIEEVDIKGDFYCATCQSTMDMK